MFYPKMESRNTKNTLQNPSPNIMFFCFLLFCALKYHAAANFLIGGCASSENVRRGF
jgi:hypothetical protein